MGDFIFDVIFFAARGSMPWAPTHTPSGGQQKRGHRRREKFRGPTLLFALSAENFLGKILQSCAARPSLGHRPWHQPQER